MRAALDEIRTHARANILFGLKGGLFIAAFTAAVALAGLATGSRSRLADRLDGGYPMLIAFFFVAGAAAGAVGGFLRPLARGFFGRWIVVSIAAAAVALLGLLTVFRGTSRFTLASLVAWGILCVVAGLVASVSSPLFRKRVERES